MKSRVRWFLVSVVAGQMIGLSDQALAQDLGAEMYNSNCAVCHGETGAGDGMVGQLFSQRPADLKLLARNNNGVFPTERVVQSIDGRAKIPGHGDTEMPVWGNFFMAEALKNQSIDPKDAATVTQARILLVVNHLETLQVK